MNAKLPVNVGSYDAAARFVVGCSLLAFLNHGYTWGFAGLPVLATVVGICPIYWLLGINTTACDRAGSMSEEERMDCEFTSSAMSREVNTPQHFPRLR